MSSIFIILVADAVVKSGWEAVFDGIRPNESLDSFIDRVVNPDSTLTSQTKAAIHSITELMKSKNIDHKIGTIIKVSTFSKQMVSTFLYSFGDFISLLKRYARV